MDASVTDLLPHTRFPPPGTAVCCAVSGGADSLALLVLAAAADLEVEAVHVDHGLRPGSAAEADIVAAAAERFGADFRALTVAVTLGSNLEARARQARYDILPAGVLLGHTADDQAETMLLNLLRGAGLDGLAGMRDDGRRPLLGLRRHQTEALCSSLGLTVVEDPSNHDPAFRRNRVRHELLPLLADIADRDPVPILARQAKLLREAGNHLDSQASALDVTDAREVTAAPSVLARRALRQWLRECGWDHPPDAAAVDRMLEVARGTRPRADIARGWTISRTNQILRVEPPPQDDR